MPVKKKKIAKNKIDIIQSEWDEWAQAGEHIVDQWAIPDGLTMDEDRLIRKLSAFSSWHVFAAALAEEEGLSQADADMLTAIASQAIMRSHLAAYRSGQASLAPTIVGGSQILQ